MLLANRLLRKKLATAASIAGTSRARLSMALLTRAVAALPNRPDGFWRLENLADASFARVADNLVRAQLVSGRVFFGHRSEGKQYVLHHLLRGVIPRHIDGDAYKLAVDIERRYFRVRAPWYFGSGGTFIEGGCYTGIKAIRWHDCLQDESRIIAVEIGKSNADLLAMNVEENGLSGAIVPVHAGLWSQSGRGVQKHSYTSRRFLDATDRWADHMVHEEPSELVSIDDLLDRHDVEVAQFVNVQVNGAELEVIKGIDRSLSRIKVIGVAAYYSQDGVPNAAGVQRYFEEKGCEVISCSKAGRVTVVTPKFARELRSMRPD